MILYQLMQQIEERQSLQNVLRNQQVPQLDIQERIATLETELQLLADRWFTQLRESQTFEPLYVAPHMDDDDIL
ncbi:hypothetical protein NV379_23610 [Paenibacillus sp. N1-5-1-14]|uniref:hypothetical protein n=1 Tax=Paenibacillus radicibacter TaxID=2972488 RepID=UPI0021594070|nr:hypothetical protein [Paenibacillus radicibacter]MCR8645631.1 hypothetical protein [Paenibacillus radicibacter]